MIAVWYVSDNSVLGFKNSKGSFVDDVDMSDGSVGEKEKEKEVSNIFEYILSFGITFLMHGPLHPTLPLCLLLHVKCEAEAFSGGLETSLSVILFRNGSSHAL
jgi:hypothetical protein